MLVACCDQKRGISTSRCSNTSWPFSLPMTAERMSQSTSSNGSIPSRVKNRAYSIPESPPGSRPGAFGGTVAGVRVGVCVLVDSACGAAALCIFASETRVMANTPKAMAQ